MNPKCASLTVQHNMYKDSKLLAPALLNWFKLVFGAFRQSRILEFYTDQFGIGIECKDDSDQGLAIYRWTEGL